MLAIFFSQARNSTVLYAANEKQVVNPSELDIYYEPPEHVYVNATSTSPNVIYNNVSAFRRSLTGVFSGLLTTHEKIDNVYNFVTSLGSLDVKLTKMYNDVMQDPYFLLTPGSIALATIGGAILAGRGKRPFKRTLYASVFGFTAASVCYPQRSVDIATTGYYHTTGAMANLYQQIKDRITTTEQAIKTIENTEQKIKETSSEFIEIENENNIVETVDAVIEASQDIVAEIPTETVSEVSEDFEIVNLTDEIASVENNSLDYNPQQTELKIVEIEIIKADIPLTEDVTMETKVNSVTEVVEGKDQTVVLDLQNETESTLKVEADYGQSNEEDSDMYSTRL